MVPEDSVHGDIGVPVPLGVTEHEDEVDALIGSDLPGEIGPSVEVRTAQDPDRVITFHV